jgi:hypothetical protein
MAAKPLPKRMFKARDSVKSTPLARAPLKLIDRMLRDHSDLLQNIEHVLSVNCYLDPTIDDRAIRIALNASLLNQRPEDPQAADLFDHLRIKRQTREDVSDDVWQKALMAVRDTFQCASPSKRGRIIVLMDIDEQW